ncbi:MAG: HutD family protein [Clostridiales bacterium]|nr:HutD family protein [Clostridiales bacterium]
MQIKIYSKKDCSTSSWAGGTTTQLWIWPNGGDYASRNFMARISSATVNLEESDFTALPGVTRYITPLSGGFTLNHQDGQTTTMAPLDEPYCFDGGAATHCSGKATDFNLMLKGVGGNMTVLTGELTVGDGICCVYPVDGDVTVDGKALNMENGGIAVIHLSNSERATIKASKAIVCRIFI